MVMFREHDIINFYYVNGYGLKWTQVIGIEKLFNFVVDNFLI
jgi:hypothetical protein